MPSTDIYFKRQHHLFLLLQVLFDLGMIGAGFGSRRNCDHYSIQISCSEADRSFNETNFLQIVPESYVRNFILLYVFYIEFSSKYFVPGIVSPEGV